MLKTLPHSRKFLIALLLAAASSTFAQAPDPAADDYKKPDIAGDRSAIAYTGPFFSPPRVLNNAPHDRASSFFSPLLANFFQPKADYTTGRLPYSVAIGDLDGDGRPELVSANGNSNAISIFRNTATTITFNDFSFGFPVNIAAGESPLSVAIGDVDGDGKADLVVANERSASVFVYRNKAVIGSITGTSFEAPVSFATGSHPYSIALADLDGDGKIDIVVANAQSNTVSVLKNTATAGTVGVSSFAAKVDFTAGANPRFVAVGDVDGDGKADIAVVNQQAATVSVMHNTTSGAAIDASSFAAKIDFTTGSEPIGVAIGDVDGDAKAELVVANFVSNSVSVFRNTAVSGTVDASSFAGKVDFATSPQPFSVALGDVDGDGKRDIAVANSVINRMTILHNNAITGNIDASSFDNNQQYITGSYPFTIVMGDLNGDGAPEVVTSNAGNNLSVFSNNSGSLSAIPPVITSFGPVSGPVGTTVTITGTDFNPTPANNTVYFGAVKATVTSASTTSLTVTAPAGATYKPITVLNTKNGLLANASSPFSLTFTNPFGSGIPGNFYQPATNFTTGSLPYTMAFGDLDGDGRTDMAVVNANSNSVSLYRNTGGNSVSSSSFAPKVDFPTGVEPRSVAIADMDGDGKPDLIFTSSAAYTVTVRKNVASPGSLTTASFTGGGQFAVGAFPYSVAVGDFDGDGRPDLVTANLYAATISVLRNITVTGALSSNSFAPKVDFVTGRNPRFVELGDLDGDGKTDIAVANQQDATVSVLRNTSISGVLNSGSFAAKVDFATGTGPQGIAISDIDRDGKADLAVVNFSSNTVSVLRNTSASGSITTSSFAGKVDITTGSGPFALVAADADGDGNIDLLTANANSSTISVLRNGSTSGSITASSFTKTDFATGGYPVYISVGDLNGNGTAEVATVNAVGNSVSVLEIIPASVSAAPVISSVSPISSPVNSAVTISGTNFNPVAANNIVYFGAVKAAVTAASASSISVTAPAGASYQPLVVLNSENGLSASSPLPFITTFNNPFGSGVPANFYRPKVDFTAGNIPYGVTLGDVDGDGKADMVIANTYVGSVSVRRNTSATGASVDASNFAPPVNFACNNPFSVVLSDIDGDGRLDIVAQNLFGSAVSILRNTSATGSITASSFAPAVSFNASPNTYSYAIAAGDLDGDGKPDIATINSSTNTLSVLRNLSVAGSITASSFAPAVNFTTGAFPRSVAISDLDGDGKADISIANANDNTVAVFRNIASTGTLTTASFAAGVNFSTGTQPSGISTGDLDGDGKADIAVLNHGSNTISVLRNSSTSGSITASSLAARVDFATGVQPYAVTIADVNGDGKPDLLAANSGSSTISVLRNSSGTGTITASSFAGKVDFAAGGYLVSIAAGDINNDGIPEVVAGSTDNPVNNDLISVLAINAPAPFTDQATAKAPGYAAQLMSEPAGSLQVYPNPTNGEFTVQLSGMTVTAGNLEILNESGKTIERRSLNFSGKASFTQRLSVAGLPAGVYYVKIITTRGVQIAKVVVQR